MSSRYCSSALSSASTCARAALTRDLPSWGKWRGATKPANRPMITITTNSSRSVKPRARGFRKRAGSYILYIVGATVRAWKALELCGLVSPIVIKDHRARQWAGALVNGGEARKPRVGDYGRSAAARLGKQRVVDAHHVRDVVARLGERWNATAVALDRILTRVIRRQRQLAAIAET